jgi:hypothetical protein
VDSKKVAKLQNVHNVIFSRLLKSFESNGLKPDELKLPVWFCSNVVCDFLHKPVERSLAK